MVHLSSQNQPIQRLAVAGGSKCVTPPKLQLKRSIPAVAGECSKVQKRSFKPLRPAIEPTSICVSPQKKRLRLNQLTPKKVRRLDEMVVNPPSSSKCLTSSFISPSSEDDPICLTSGMPKMVAPLLHQPSTKLHILHMKNSMTALQKRTPQAWPVR